MRKWQFLSALVVAVVSVTLSAYANDRPPCSGDKGDEKRAPAKADKKGSARADADKAEPKKDAAKKAEPKKSAAKKAESKKSAAKKAEPKKSAAKNAGPNEDADKKKKKVEQPPSSKKKPTVAPRVTLGEPKFMGGHVKLVKKMLHKTLGKVATCVEQADGLTGGAGFFKVQFLVRVRGRAEGVEVLQRKGASKSAGDCVRKMLKNRWVGTPTEDPVGVTFRYNLAAPPSR